MQVKSGEGFDVRYMIYDKDFSMFILSYYSLVQNTGRKFKLYIWDGGLTKEQRKQITELFPGVTIKQMLAKGKTIKEFEKRYTAYINKPLMDVHYLRDKKFIGIDPDVIFYKEPKEIIDWIDNDNDTNLFLSDCTNGYMNNYEKIFDKLVEKLNAGLLCLQSYTLPDFETAYDFFNNKSTKNPDQTFYAYCLAHCKYKYKRLDRYKYKIFIHSFNEWSEESQQYVKNNIQEDYDEHCKYLKDKNTICFHFINSSWKKFLKINDDALEILNPDEV